MGCFLSIEEDDEIKTINAIKQCFIDGSASSVKMWFDSLQYNNVHQRMIIQSISWYHYLIFCSLKFDYKQVIELILVLNNYRNLMRESNYLFVVPPLYWNNNSNKLLFETHLDALKIVEDYEVVSPQTLILQINSKILPILSEKKQQLLTKSLQSISSFLNGTIKYDERLFSYSEDSKEQQHDVIHFECKVCVSNSRSHLFGPCKHFVCCENCSSRVTHCPLCRSLIITKERIYF